MTPMAESGGGRTDPQEVSVKQDNGAGLLGGRRTPSGALAEQKERWEAWLGPGKGPRRRLVCLELPRTPAVNHPDRRARSTIPGPSSSGSATPLHTVTL